MNVSNEDATQRWSRDNSARCWMPRCISWHVYLPAWLSSSGSIYKCCVNTAQGMKEFVEHFSCKGLALSLPHKHITTITTHGRKAGDISGTNNTLLYFTLIPPQSSKKKTKTKQNVDRSYLNKLDKKWTQLNRVEATTDCHHSFRKVGEVMGSSLSLLLT